MGPDDEAPASEIHFGLLPSFQIWGQADQGLLEMVGLAGRTDRNDRSCLWYSLRYGKHGGAAETVTNQDLRGLVALAHEIRRRREVLEVR